MNAQVRDLGGTQWSCGESNSRAIAVTCTQHGAAGFTNLMVSKHDGTVCAAEHRAAPGWLHKQDHKARLT